MAVRLSALRTRRTLFPRNIIILTSCTRPRVAVAHSGEMEEKEDTWGR
jgi:hypothetical protein